MLANKRAATQKELLETAPEASLLSATMNIPGEVKIRPLNGCFEVIDEVEQQCWIKYRLLILPE